MDLKSKILCVVMWTIENKLNNTTEWWTKKWIQRYTLRAYKHALKNFYTPDSEPVAPIDTFTVKAIAKVLNMRYCKEYYDTPCLMCPLDDVHGCCAGLVEESASAKTWGELRASLEKIQAFIKRRGAQPW